MPPDIDTLSTWLTYIEQVHPQAIDLGLERVRAVASQLISKPKATIITVAGTNGKGTTVKVLESIAMAKNLRVASYTSPHIWHFNERIQIQQEPVNDNDLIRAFKAVEAARTDVTLSYFEYTTLAALWLFEQTPVDLIILEVGMGGRLDATNIIDADIAIITSISYDHQAYLGDTLEAIATEKCGIMRKNKPVICGERPMSAHIKKYADNIQAPFYMIDDAPYREMNVSLIPSNIACAHKAMTTLGCEITLDELSSIVKNIRFPGRGYHCKIAGKQVLLDVAHNEASIERLHLSLRTNPSQRKLLVLGILADKHMPEALNALCAEVNHIFLAQPQTPRGLDTQSLSAQLSTHTHKITDCKKPDQALNEALKLAREDDLVIVTGSFYMISGSIPSRLTKKSQNRYY